MSFTKTALLIPFSFAFAMLFQMPLASIPPTEKEFRSCLKSAPIALGKYEVVAQALSLYNIQQSQWLIVTKNFQSRLSSFPRLLSKSAEQQFPNPLHPYNGKAAVALAHRLLLRLWGECLSYRDINVKAVASPTLAYIISLQPEPLQHCLIPEGER